jgi:head-tail adaptor
MKLPFKAPRIDTGDLRTIVTFYEYQANDGPEPGESEKKVLFTCYAKIDEVWSKDLEVAKANDTLSDITLTIRDTHGEYIPTTKHYIEVDLPEYADKVYNIKHTQPDPQSRDFIKIISGMVAD